MDQLTREEQKALDALVEAEMREMGIDPIDSEDEDE